MTTTLLPSAIKASKKIKRGKSRKEKRI